MKLITILAAVLVAVSALSAVNVVQANDTAVSSRRLHNHGGGHGHSHSTPRPRKPKSKQNLRRLHDHGDDHDHDHDHDHDDGGETARGDAEHWEE
jgi:ABC-type Zn2+ transport system substrate-binding protein/surface adhesin